MSADKWNQSSFVFLGISMVGTLLFFILVLIINPGPIDRGLEALKASFGSHQSEERVRSWLAINEENKRQGAQLYEINCVFCHSQSGSDEVIARIADGMTSTSLYNSMHRGLRDGHKFDYLPKKVKLNIVSFLRSKMTNAPKDPSGYYKSFVEEQ